MLITIGTYATNKNLTSYCLHKTPCKCFWYALPMAFKVFYLGNFNGIFLSITFKD